MLADHHMPGPSGPELEEAVHRVARDTCFVGMSGLTPDDTGAAPFLAKPFDRATLLDTVAAALAP